jgi:hypothetical protein
MTMTSYTLFILPPGALSLRAIGTLYPSDHAELDVCLLACVSLLCGLQASGEQPCFRLSGYDESGRSIPLALLNDHTQGWVTPDNRPFTVEAL